MVSATEGEAEKPADPAAPAATRAARFLLLAAVFVFLVLPAVAMFVLLTSGSSLSDLFDTALSEFGKQLSSVGQSL
ncbi:MAG TPA: hypothetical protein VF337_11810 [Candidatus Limnocylindrales bacterium]